MTNKKKAPRSAKKQVSKIEYGTNVSVNSMEGKNMSRVNSGAEKAMEKAGVRVINNKELEYKLNREYIYLEKVDAKNVDYTTKVFIKINDKVQLKNFPGYRIVEMDKDSGYVFVDGKEDSFHNYLIESNDDVADEDEKISRKDVVMMEFEDSDFWGEITLINFYMLGLDDYSDEYLFEHAFDDEDESYDLLWKLQGLKLKEVFVCTNFQEDENDMNESDSDDEKIAICVEEFYEKLHFGSNSQEK